MIVNGEFWGFGLKGQKKPSDADVLGSGKLSIGFVDTGSNCPFVWEHKHKFKMAHLYPCTPILKITFWFIDKSAVSVCVCCTHNLVETALACGEQWLGMCWAMAGRDDSSLSEVSDNKVSVFIPTMRGPSSCSWPGAVSWAEGKKVWVCRERSPYWIHCAGSLQKTHRVNRGHLVDNHGGLKNTRQRDNKQSVDSDWYTTFLPK